MYDRNAFGDVLAGTKAGAADARLGSTRTAGKRRFGAVQRTKKAHNVVLVPANRAKAFFFSFSKCTATSSSPGLRGPSLSG